MTYRQPDRNTRPSGKAGSPVAGATENAVKRIKSHDLLERSNEVEIDHDGRIYRLRITQMNKLILTA